MSTSPTATQTRVNDEGMIVGGGIVTGIGGTGVLVGGITLGVGGLSSAGAAGLILLISGGICSAIGIPILVSGAVQVPVETPPPEKDGAPTGPVRMGPRDGGMVIAGGVLTALGGTAAVGGGIAIGVGIDQGDQFASTGGLISLVLGVATAGVGIPVLAVGAYNVPIGVSVSVGPGNLSLLGSF